MILNLSIQMSGSTLLKTFLSLVEIGVVITIGFNVYILVKNKTFYKKGLDYLKKLIDLFIQFIKDKDMNESQLEHIKMELFELRDRVDADWTNKNIDTEQDS